MSKERTVSEKILKDLEEISALAIDQGHLTVALKVLELLGKEQGLFLQKKPLDPNHQISLSRLSDEDLTRLMEEIETQLTLDQQEEGR